ncbi:MAG TPA: hypothetical protein V6C63_12255 [Allocoleopsis sp.]
MTARVIVNAVKTAIKTEAQAIWGEDDKQWIPNLVKRYCELESQETGKTIKTVQRRSQILTALGENGNPTLETAARLAACVGGEFQLAFQRTEIKRF